MKKIKDLHIKAHNGSWFFVMALIVLFITVIAILGNKLSIDGRFNFLLVLSIFEFVYLRVYKYSLRFVHKKYEYYNELPCYLCNFSTIICIIAAITRNSVLMAYCFTAGVIGALLALILPDPYYKDIPLLSIPTYGFYGYHALLLATCLGFYLFGLYKPNPIDALWATLITFGLSFIAHITNYILRKTGLNEKSNYVFTYEPGNAVMKKLYSIFKVKLLYLIPILLVVGFVSFLILLVLS